MSSDVRLRHYIITAPGRAWRGSGRYGQRTLPFVLLGCLLLLASASGSVAERRPKPKPKATKVVEESDDKPVTSPAEVTDRLREIKGEVAAKSRELETAQRERREISIVVAGLESRLKELDQREKELLGELVELEETERSTTVEVNALESEVDRRQAFGRKRVRSLAMRTGLNPQVSGLQLALAPWTGGQEFTPDASVFLLQRVHAYEGRELAHLQANRAKLQKLLEEVRALGEQKRATHRELDTQRTEISQKKGEFTTAQQNLTRRENELRQAVTKLRTQALRLETVVRSLTDGTVKVSTAPAARTAPPVDLGTGPIRAPTVQGEFLGRGLVHLRGALPRPADGEVLRGFGTYKAGEFADLVFQRGIEFGGLVNRSVRAVADGRVMYQGEMPGYGQVVILDHGERFYSVYGRLGTSLVTVGQVVSGGEAVGAASSPDSSGRMLYFEIRRNGKPEDPGPFFAKNR